MTLTECVNLWFEATGRKKKDVAAKAGMAATKLSEIVSGKNPDPQWSTVEKLARGFGVTTPVFLAGPRSEQESERDEQRRREEGHPVFADMLARRDQKTPAEDSWRGDVLRAQDALTEAALALNRALRREAAAGESAAPPAKAGR